MRARLLSVVVTSVLVGCTPSGGQPTTADIADYMARRTDLSLGVVLRSCLVECTPSRLHPGNIPKCCRSYISTPPGTHRLAYQASF